MKKIILTMLLKNSCERQNLNKIKCTYAESLLIEYSGGDFRTNSIKERNNDDIAVDIFYEMRPNTIFMCKSIFNTR